MYIYYPGPGEEQLFDLRNDPDELTKLIDDNAYTEVLEQYRHNLIQELEGRPEAFVKDGKLILLGGPTLPYLPGYERKE